MKRNIQSRDEILLDAQFGDVERMPHVLRMHQQVDLAVDRNRHLGSDDVVFGILVIGSVETKEVRVGLTDLVRVNWAEGSVGARVAEIECELSSLNLYGQRVGGGRSEIDAGPRLCPEYAQSQTFCAHQQEGGDHQSRSAAGETLDLVGGLGSGKLPDKESKEELRGQERNARLDHGIGELLIDQMTVGGNVGRHRPHVHHDGNGRSNCDHNDRHREYLRHIVPPLAGSDPASYSNRRRVWPTAIG